MHNFAHDLLCGAAAHPAAQVGYYAVTAKIVASVLYLNERARARLGGFGQVFIPLRIERTGIFGAQFGGKRRDELIFSARPAHIVNALVRKGIFILFGGAAHDENFRFIIEFACAGDELAALFFSLARDGAGI